MARLDSYGDRYMDVWQPAMFEVNFTIFLLSALKISVV